MIRKTSIAFLAFFIMFVSSSFAQETAPLRTFKFNISITSLKTEDQAKSIQEAVSKLPGVRQSELILINYELNFEVTNHDLDKNQIIDKVKQIILENGAEIVKINRSEK